MLAGCGGGASPTPTSIPRAAVAPGTYASSSFRPPITYTLPAGWLIADDAPDYLALEPVASDQVGIRIFRSPQAASQDPTCPIAAAPGIGTTAKDLVDWIRSRPGLVAGDPVAVTIGGLVGLQVDIAIIGGWKPSCPFASGIPTVALFVGTTDTSFRWVVAGSERLRLAVLDVPGAGTVVVDIDAYAGLLNDGLLPAAAPIIGSLKFGLP
jgi:hypothetical protein